MTAPSTAWWRSLRWRLLAATVVALSLALLLAGWILSGLFRQHVLEQFRGGLQRQLDQLTSQVELDAAGQPTIDVHKLSDPRWTQPYSGLYWQIDRVRADQSTEVAVLRSRSLWDQVLHAPNDQLHHGVVHAHELNGPNGEPALLLERLVRHPQAPSASWRLMVAGNLAGTHGAVRHFAGVLAASLGVLLLLLVAAAWAQVTVGLRPLRTLQLGLRAVQQAHTTRLEGQFPTELQPLVDDFNHVLAQNQAVVERSRTHAGNLAHALKTPLSVLQQAAAQCLPDSALTELAQLVQEQTLIAQRQIDWHLAHARASAVQRLPGQRTEIQPTVLGLVRVMKRVHAARELVFETTLPPQALYFAGEAQDLHEILGNLLDNACKWAHHTVTLQAERLAESTPPTLRVIIADDGPGLDPTQIQQVMARGVRLDESVRGSGLGLAIAKDLIEMYGGSLELQRQAKGGLQAQVLLPATAVDLTPPAKN